MSNLTSASHTIIDQQIVDQRRGIVTHSKALSNNQFNRYYRNDNKVMRPDLYPFQLYRFQKLHVIAEKYLSQLRTNFNAEVWRANHHTSNAYLRDHKEALYENYYTLNSPIVHNLVRQGYRTWRDASALVNYIEALYGKLYNFGLIYSTNLTRKQKQQMKEHVKKELRKRLNE